MKINHLILVIEKKCKTIVSRNLGDAFEDYVNINSFLKAEKAISRKSEIIIELVAYWMLINNFEERR